MCFSLWRGWQVGLPMCSQHISMQECRAVSLDLPPTTLQASLSESPGEAALCCPASWFTFVMGTGDGSVFGGLSGHCFSWQVAARRAGGGGFVGLIPVTSGSFWLQSHCKTWKLTSGVPQAKGKVLFIFICWLYKDYNDRERAAMISYHLTIQIQPPRRQCCKLKLRWWLKRDQGCLSSVWKTGGGFSARYLFRKHGGVLHQPALHQTDPFAKSPVPPLTPPAFLSQAICSKTHAQTPIFCPELSHLPKTYLFSSPVVVLSSPSL